MKLKMFKQWLEQNLISMTMSLHVNKNACLKHNHTAEYVNIIKLNFAVKITVDNEMIKEYASI